MDEVCDLIESYRRTYQAKEREKVYKCFMLAGLINERHPMVDKTKQVLSKPWDYYPELFKKEKIRYEEQQEVNELEEYKEKRRQYASIMNKRREGGV